MLMPSHLFLAFSCVLLVILIRWSNFLLLLLKAPLQQLPSSYERFLCLHLYLTSVWQFPVLLCYLISPRPSCPAAWPAAMPGPADSINLFCHPRMPAATFRAPTSFPLFQWQPSLGCVCIALHCDSDVSCWRQAQELSGLVHKSLLF